MGEKIPITKSVTGFIAIALIAFLTGCAVSTKLLPTPEQLVSHKSMVNNSEIESLQRGRDLAIRECAVCHLMFWPSEFSREEWPEIIRSMGNRASLDMSQVEDIEKYFAAASESRKDPVSFQ